MKLQVQRWGNSLALRIPKSVAMNTKIEQGTTVELTLEEGSIVVKPVTAKEYTLDELVAGITKQNRHEEVSTATRKDARSGNGLRPRTRRALSRLF